MRCDAMLLFSSALQTMHQQQQQWQHSNKDKQTGAVIVSKAAAITTKFCFHCNKLNKLKFVYEMGTEKIPISGDAY